MRKASVVAGSIAAATAGSAIFGGVALACNHHHSHHKSHHCCDSGGGGDHNSRGGDAFGGKAINNCLNLGIPILSGNGILGQGEAGGASCYASADAHGGDAY